MTFVSSNTPENANNNEPQCNQVNLKFKICTEQSAENVLRNAIDRLLIRKIKMILRDYWLVTT